MAFITYKEKDNKIKQVKGIQEITINSFNSNNDTNQLSILTRKGNYYKKDHLIFLIYSIMIKMIKLKKIVIMEKHPLKKLIK